MVEPEVDLSEFMERQRLQDDDVAGPSQQEQEEYDESEVDQSLAHLWKGGKAGVKDRKGKVQKVEWDEELESMRRDKDAADAQRGVDEDIRLEVKPDPLDT